MKIKEGFLLRTVVGEHVVIAVGPATLVLNGLIKLNDTGALLWNAILDGTPADKLAGLLSDTCGISAEQAQAGVDGFLDTLRSIGCLEE